MQAAQDDAPKKKLKGFGAKPKAKKAKEAPAKRAKAKNHAIADKSYSLVLRLPAAMKEPLARAKQSQNCSLNTYIYNLLSATLDV